MFKRFLKWFQGKFLGYDYCTVCGAWTGFKRVDQLRVYSLLVLYKKVCKACKGSSEALPTELCQYICNDLDYTLEEVKEAWEVE